MTRAACASRKRADRDDAAAADADVGGKPGIAGAVEDAAVPDEQIERRGRLRAGAQDRSSATSTGAMRNRRRMEGL